MFKTGSPARWIVVCVAFAVLAFMPASSAFKATTPDFVTSTLTGFGAAWNVVIDDVNGDGHADLIGALVLPGENSIGVALGDGAGGFGAVSKFFSGARPSSLAIADMNGDGFKDVVVANQNGDNPGGNVAVMLGNGTGAFGPPNITVNAQFATALKVGDFNGDGAPDVAVLDFGAWVHIFFNANNGSGQLFAGSQMAVPTATPARLDVGDFNLDGHLDIAVVSTNTDPVTGGTNALAIYLNGGTGVFLPPAFRSFPNGYKITDVAVGNLDADAAPEIVVVSSGGVAGDGGAGVWVFDNDGAGNIAAVPTRYAAPVGASGAAIGDLDGDGFPDIIVALRDTANVSYYLNNGDGTFAAAAGGAYPGITGQPQYVAVGEFDAASPASLDIVLARFAADPIYLHNRPNFPPVANAGPDQSVTALSAAGASVTLDGSASSDPENTALTFVWRDGANAVVASTATANMTAPLGADTYTLTVTDAGGASATDTVTITVLAGTTTSIACASPMTYTGAAITPCTASVLGVDGFTLTSAPDYAGNTNAGTANATWTFLGDATHGPSFGSATFVIAPKPITATLAAANKGYDSTATEPDANMTCTLAGVVAGDAVTCTATGGAFNGAAVGSGNVTATGTLAGAQAGNYTLGAPGSAISSAPIAAAISTTAQGVYGQLGNFTTASPNNGGLANGMANPARVATDSHGGFYVVESSNNRVTYYPAGSTVPTRVYGQGGSFTTNAPNKGGVSADSLRFPRAVWVDVDDNVYIADGDNSRVLFYAGASTTATRVYGQGGNFASAVGNNGGLNANSLSEVLGVVTDANGVYIADRGNRRVLYYAGTSTTATRVYGQLGGFTGYINIGTTADTLVYPTGLAIDSGGNLYVSDQADKRVLFYPSGSTTATRVYGQNGNFTTTVGTTSATGLTWPMGIALDHNDNLYVTDLSNNRVLFYTAGSTTATRVYGQNGSFTTGGFVGGISANSLLNPSGVAIGSDGSLYVADFGASRVLRYSTGSLGVITTAPITAALTANGKVYDGTTGEPDAAMACTLSGVLPADAGGITCTATNGTFDSADAGARTVTATVTISGSASSNYTLGTGGTAVTSTSATASTTITAKTIAVTGVTAADKTYDATIAATINSAGATLSGVVSGETVTLNTGALVGTFDTPAAGDAKTVTVSALSLAGATAGNYVLSAATLTTTANILTKPLLISILIQNKTYDGTTAGSFGGCGITGVVPSDAGTVNCAGSTGSFPSPNAGVQTANTIPMIGGAGVGNYTLGAAGTHVYSTTGTATATILTKVVTASLVASAKTYDATTLAGPVSCTIAGLIAADVAGVTCSASGAVFDSAAVGARTVSATVTLTGAPAGNYTFGAGGTTVTSSTATTASSITTRAVTATLTAQTKTYDADTTEPDANMTCTLTGVIAGDAASCVATSGTFNSAAAGSTTVTATATLAGSSAGNYTLGVAGTTVVSTPVTAIGTLAGSTTANAVYGQLGSFTTAIQMNGGVNADSLWVPTSVAVDSHGGLYVAEEAGNRVLYYAAGSTTASRVYGQGGSFTTNGVNTGGLSAMSLGSPRQLALDASDNLYVADAGNNRVLYFPAGSTTSTRVYGQGGSFTTGTANKGGVSADSLGDPNGVGVDGAGNVYIVDRLSNRVLVFAPGSTTATGVYGQTSFTTSGNSVFNLPVNLVVDATGALYVADPTSNRILYFPAGSTSFTRFYGFTNNACGLCAASLNNPSLGGLDANGNLYVADLGNNRVLFFPAGSTTATRVYGQHGSFTSNGVNAGGLSADTLRMPRGVATGPDGTLYIADYANQRVLRYLTTGSGYIATAPLTATLTAADKVYDGTTAEPNGSMSCTLSGVLPADAGNVTCAATSGAFDGASAGAHTVTATVTIGGSGAANYTLGAAGTAIASQTATAAATITGAPSTTTISCPASVTFDGTAQSPCTATVTSVGGFSASVSVTYTNNVNAGTATAIATFADDGAHLTSSDSTTFAIAAAQLTATLAANGKAYDRTTAEPDASLSCTLSGVMPSDAANVTCAATGGVFDSASAGARTVTATVTVGGSAAGNYTLGATGTSVLSQAASAASNISTRAATVTITAGDKVYDGSAVEPDAAIGCAVTGVLAGDAVSCTATDGSFNGAAVGSGAVTATATLGGPQSGNYTLGAPGTTVWSITAGVSVSTTAQGVYGQGGSFTAANPNNGGLASGMSQPLHIAVDSHGGLYVPESLNNRVMYFPAGSTTATRVYGQSGSFTTNIANKGGISADSLSFPRGVWVDTDDNVFIADGNNGRVLFYAAGSTTATRVYGQAGSFTTGTSNGIGLNADSIGEAHAIVTDAAGNVYIADRGNRRVLFYPGTSTTATRVYGAANFTTIGLPGPQANSLTYPTALALDSTGSLYVSDQQDHRVLVYPAGSTTATRVYGQAGSFTTNGTGTSAAAFNRPSGIAVDASDNLYVTDLANNRLLYFPAGSTTATRVYGQNGSFTSNGFTGVSAGSLSSPQGVGVSSDGQLFVADTSVNRVLRYSTDSAGRITTAPLTVTLSATGKVYDGTTIEPDAGLACTVIGLVAGEAGQVACTATNGSFDTANAGARTVTATITISGAASSNYTFGVTGTSTVTTIATAAATIATATSTTELTCPASVIANGAAQTPCTAIATGAGGLSTPVAVTYTNNVMPGTASAAATFSGDANHTASSGTATFTIESAVAGVMSGNGEVPSIPYLPGRLLHFDFTAAQIALGPGGGGLSFWTTDAKGRVLSDNTFDASAITSTIFSDDPTFTSGGGKAAAIDTVVIRGTGTWNGDDGFTFEARATDQGEPGVGKDTFTLTIYDSVAIGKVILNVNGLLTNGNVASSRLPGRTGPPLFLSSPSNQIVEATSAAGAVVTYPPATAVDSHGVPVYVVCDPASGTMFPLGRTRGVCSATDSRGTTKTTPFIITVIDSQAPTFASVPADITVEADRKGGALVAYVTPTATDAVDTAVVVNCTPASDRVFAPGLTTVQCTATDDSKNVATASFQVAVVDTTAPVFGPIPNVVVPATSPAGATVNFRLPAATDAVDGRVIATCAPAPGSTFPIGTTTVTCAAVDGAGNSATTFLRVTVGDTKAPKITITEPGGSYVRAEVVRVSYACSDTGSGVATCVGNFPSGATLYTLVPGTYAFTVTATDAAGNSSTKTVTYTVKRK